MKQKMNNALILFPFSLNIFYFLFDVKRYFYSIAFYRLLFTFFYFFFSFWGIKWGYAQQPPQWTQYVFNNYMLNPAVGGTKGYMDIKLGYRYQWLGIFNAPPRTMFVSVHTPFNLYQEPTEYTKQYQGIGGSISNDVTGPISNITGKISWSFHKRLTRDMWSSAGISGGVMQYRLNAGGLAAGPLGSEDANDPDVRNISAITPDVQGGVWVASDKFFSGFSIEQIIPLKLGGTKNRMKHHYLFNGGYRHNISPWLAFVPSAEIKTGLITPLTFDVDVVAEYRNKYPGILEKISGGVGYRKHDAVLLLVGVVLGNWEIGYSFDYTLSSLGRYSSNTHELIIGFRFTNIEKEPRCPKWG